jgi:hypothetical protein
MLLGLYKKLCRENAEVIQNYENECVHSVGQGESGYKKYKSLKLGYDQAYDHSSK